MRIVLTILAFFWAFLLAPAASAQFWKQFSPSSPDNASPYRSYIYHEASSTEPAGLIIFLHGGRPIVLPTESRGFNALWSPIEGITAAMSGPAFADYAEDYYIVSPHYYDPCPYSTTAECEELWLPEWDPARLDQYIDHIIQKFNSNPLTPFVDENKIVVFGFSVGGKGTWDYAQIHHERLAGALPLFASPLPDGTLGNWCDMRDLSIWAINGEMDPVFPVDTLSSSGRIGINDFESVFNACGVNHFTKTFLTGRTHTKWEYVYELRAGFDIYKWMTSLERVGGEYPPGNTYEPLVNLGPDKTILDTEGQWVVHAQAIDLLGRDFDSFEWSVNGNPSSPFIDLSDSLEFLILQNLPVGIHTVRLTVNSGVDSNFDEMTINVLDADTYTGSKITEFQILYNKGTYVPVNNDRLDSDIYAVGNLFNVSVSGNFNSTDLIRTEINNNFFWNEANAVGFNFESNLQASSLRLYSGRTRRETYVANVFNTSDIYLLSSQFSVFFSNDQIFLPITLLSFTGEVEERGVRLDWTTTEEKDNSHFELYRGRSGDDLIKIAEVDKAPPGNLYNYYSFTDQEARDGIYYYQLQSVDYDGHRDISDIIRVAITAGDEFVLYPNPAANGQFQITNSGNNPVRPEVFNSHGQQVGYSVSPSPNGPGEVQLRLDDPRPGLYLLKIWYQGEQIIRKVLIE